MQQFVYYLKYVLRDHYLYYFFKVYMFDLPVCVYNMCWPCMIATILPATGNKPNCFISAEGMLTIIWRVLLCCYLFCWFYMLTNHLLKKKRFTHVLKVKSNWSQFDIILSMIVGSVTLSINLSVGNVICRCKETQKHANVKLLCIPTNEVSRTERYLQFLLVLPHIGQD